MTTLWGMLRAGLPALAAALLAAAAAEAQVGVVFNRTGSGARAAGMANAFIAVSDDGTAASWNPGGLAQLRKPELSVVSTTAGDEAVAAGFRSRDDLSAFSTLRSSYGKTYLDFASLAVPLTLWGKPVTFQASWRRLYALDFRELGSITREPLHDEGPPPLRLDGNSDTVGGVDLGSLAAAVRLTSRLSLGASLNLWRGDWTETATVSETQLDAAQPPRFGRAAQTNRLRGESLALGLLLSYPRFSVGLLYQGPVRSDYTATVTQVLSDDPVGVDETVVGTVRFPMALGLGAALRPAPRWTVALDLTWDEWSDAQLDTPLTGRVNLFDDQPLDSTASRDTLSLNVGAERLFAGDGFVVPLRFGLAWEPQGARDPYTRDPVDYVMLALGTGYNTNSLKLDAAFQYRFTSFTTGADFGLVDADPLLPSAVGERTIHQWRLKLSLIFRITDTDRLKQAAKKVFG